MHNTDFDLTIEEMTKIEGAASLTLAVRNGKVTTCEFGIVEMQRFFEEALRGKPITAVPSLVARVCGTCSNAHLLASIKTLESGLGVTPSDQTMLLRKLLTYGLMIRDHALHLYVFVLPDLFQKNLILDFDEHNPIEHQFLDDTFSVKEIGNKLGIVAGGRSVHAPYPRVGGILAVPTLSAIHALIPELSQAREAVLRLINIFNSDPTEVISPFHFLALVDHEYSFLEGTITTDSGMQFSIPEYEQSLKKYDVPYSHASGYQFRDEVYVVGALARMNINRNNLHPHTTKDAAFALEKFPSQNIFHNNLAQAIEILHAIDKSIDLIQGYEGIKDTSNTIIQKKTIARSVIEAPRGTLFHRYDISSDGKVMKAKIIVPTGINQPAIEESIRLYVNEHLDLDREQLSGKIESVVRAFDPCMSCATHFLKINWT